MRNIIILLSAIVVFVGLCLAQPTIDWQCSLGGIDDDDAWSIQQTADGGYIVAGHSESNDGDVTGNHGVGDYWVVKLNSSGTIDWQKSIGGTYWDYARSVQQTADGGFIVAGYSSSDDGDVSGLHGGAGSYSDYWVVKLDSSGELVWQKCLGGTDWDYLRSIQQTSDGGYIVAGASSSDNGDVTVNHGSRDYWVVKLDSSGEIEWEKSLGGSNWDYAYSVRQTVDGGFIVAGYSSSTDGDVTGHHGSPGEYYDYWIVKLDSAGEIEWEKSLGGSDSEKAYAIQQTTDGGFIVTGYSMSNDGDVTGHHGTAGDYSDYWVVKLDSAGEIEWEKSLGGSDWDYSYSVQQTSDGNFLVAGYTGSDDGDVTENNGNYDYWIVKLSSSGEIVWEKSLGGSEYEFAYSIQQTDDGGYIVAGHSESNDGDVTGHHGSTHPDSLCSDYWIVKLSPDAGIAEGGGKLPFVLTIDVCPNPFNSSCAITAPSGAEVEVWDLRGNVVCTHDVGAWRRHAQQDNAEEGHVNAMSQQNRTFIWHPAQTIASGLYLVRAKTQDGRTTTKRIVYIR